MTSLFVIGVFLTKRHTRFDAYQKRWAYAVPYEYFNADKT